MHQRTNRKPLVLHMGLQKTGTSSIQVMLNATNGVLETHGYTYPKLPVSGGRSHVWTSAFRHNCVAGTYADFCSAFEKMTPEEDREFWQNLREGPLVPVLSAEEFSRQIDNTELATRLADFDVHVVIYIRRQDKFAESLFNQRNKILIERCDERILQLGVLSEAALFEFLKDENYNHILNFENLLQRIKTQIAPAWISVRNFDRDHLEGGDVCKDFWWLLGLPEAQFKPRPKEANVSVSNTEIAKLLHPLEQGDHAGARAVLHDLSDRLRKGQIASGDYKILSASTRQHLLTQFKEINATLEREYGLSFG